MGIEAIMTPIYPVTSLQKNSAEVRKAAHEDIVHITENGRSAYIFASEDVFDEYVAAQRADAAREALLFEAIDKGIADYEAGRYYTFSSVEEMFEHLDGRASKQGGETS